MPRVDFDSDSDDLPDIRRLRTEDGRGRHRRDDVNVFLNVPGGSGGGRGRSRSQGGSPQPKIYVNNITPGGRSPSRRRDSSSDCGSRQRRRRPSQGRRDSSYERWKREREIDEIERERERRRNQVEFEAEEARRQREKEKRRIEREYEMQKEDDERERVRILREEEIKRKEKEEKDKAYKERIKAELAADEIKEKAKKKKHEEELEREMKEKLLEAGYTSKQADAIIHNKKHSTGRRDYDPSTAMERHRPTFIKVKKKYLLPATLEHYGLAWEWDPHDDEYIIIKEWVDHDFQEVLFEHTRKIKETRLITPGYTKDTVTVLKPNVETVVKKSDQMFLVRKKSRSRSRDRRSGGWF